MLDTVTIQNGYYRCDLRLERIHDWPAAAWRSAMRQMVRGGELNRDAAETLGEWFPEAIREAAVAEKDALRAFRISYRPLKDVPKDRREAQKSLNQALKESVREIRNKHEKLKLRFTYYLAAKAEMKKEI